MANQGNELLDVLDENGVFTGKIATRKEIHQQGLWHRAIIVAVINKNNMVLVQQRAKNKEKFPGLWDLSVAGHVPMGQDSVSCVVAETMEELGYMLKKDVKVQDFRFMTSFRKELKVKDDFIENQFYDFFVYNVGSNFKADELHLQKDEVEDIKWVTAFEIKEMREKGLLHPRTEWLDVLYKYITRF